LESLDGAIPSGAIVIDHSTVAPGPTRARFARMQSRGVAFLHAPVFMSPAGVREGTGVMLVSGPQNVYESVRAELAPMASDLWYLGETPDKAATIKLFGNSMLVFMSAALADGLTLANGAGVTPDEALALFEHFKLQGALEFRGKKMARGDFAPMFELTMARKDVRLMLETAQSAGDPLHILPAIATRMDALIARGFGASDMSVLGADITATNALA